MFPHSSRKNRIYFFIPHSEIRIPSVELANDYVGYIPTVKAFDEGGYETMFARSSKLVPESAVQFTESAVKLLGNLQK